MGFKRQAAECICNLGAGRRALLGTAQIVPLKNISSLSDQPERLSKIPSTVERRATINQPSCKIRFKTMGKCSSYK